MQHVQNKEDNHDDFGASTCFSVEDEGTVTYEAERVDSGDEPQ